MKVTRKALLFVPGCDHKKCEKALALDISSVIFDLEDSVAPEKKEEAREYICKLLQKLDDFNREIVVRVNKVSTLRGIDDLRAIIPLKPDAIVIPMASVREVIIADTILRELDPEGEIEILPLVETAEGLMKLSELFKWSSRISGLIFGAEDFTKELGVKRTREGNEIAYARNHLTLIAKEYGIDAIDTPFIDFLDNLGLKNDLAYIISIGMTAKTAIHPNQVEEINAAFAYNLEEIEEAKKIVEAFERAIGEGKGACAYEGRMIDAPIAQRASDLLKAAGIIAQG